jgi:hypothetical protein
VARREGSQQSLFAVAAEKGIGRGSSLMFRWRESRGPSMRACDVAAEAVGGDAGAVGVGRCRRL